MRTAIPFSKRPQGWRDQARIYWMLTIRGPLTMTEIRSWCNWTTARTNAALYALQKIGEVTLTARRTRGPSGHRCGLYTIVVK